MISYEDFISLAGITSQEAYDEFLALEPDAQKDVLGICADPIEQAAILEELR